MPPKPKKPRAKPKPKPKSTNVTNTTSSSAVVRGKGQAQVVNIYTTESRSRAGKSRGPPKAKSRATGTTKGGRGRGPSASLTTSGYPSLPPSPGPDGWYPPQNLGRSGSIFPPYGIYGPYQSLAPPPPPPKMLMPPPQPSQTFTERAGSQFPMIEANPEAQSGFDTAFEPDDELPEPPPAPKPKKAIEAPRPPLNFIQEIQERALARKERPPPPEPEPFVRPMPPMQREILEQIAKRQERGGYLVNEPDDIPELVPAPEPAPTFTEVASRAPKVTAPKEIKETKQQIASELNALLRSRGVPETGPKKTNFLKELYGDKYKAGSKPTDYSYDDLVMARNKLQAM